MSTIGDEPGLNGRLRPRKPVASPKKSKSDRKLVQDTPKRTSTPSKVSPNKHDDLANKSDLCSTLQFLCCYCDKRFGSKKMVTKHVRRLHGSPSKQSTSIECLFCTHMEPRATIIQHMVDCHPNQYFACVDCYTRFASTSELAEHKLNVCEQVKHSYRNRLRKKVPGGNAAKTNKKSLRDLKQDLDNVNKVYQDGHTFNGIVISCEVKPSQMVDNADIEENIPRNVILPSSGSITARGAGLDKGAVIVLDEIQWKKRLPPNVSFHNTDADQILSRLGVVHKSPRAGDATRRDCINEEQFPIKFEKCFDTSFYSKVASNVQENLTKFLDGSFNFNPDPDKAIKTRKAKNSVVINTAEGFPILLACEQYSRSVFDGYMPRAIAPKHKWKWDSLENEKTLMSADQIKRDSHTNNCIITLVSSLDIWTQLRMRRKFEDKFGAKPIEKKTEKQNIIGKELKEILESREIPSVCSVVKVRRDPEASSSLEFPARLGLARAADAGIAPVPASPAVLSGEWVRPRCYVCCACGAQTRDGRALSLHIATHHPNAQVHHYEIVGEQLLNADILKHLYVPPSQVTNRTRPPRGFRECTKCQKSITLEDLHQHMLECAGDTPAVRRRQGRHRLFGVRKRRSRVPDNSVRKKIRKSVTTKQRRQKKIIRTRPTIRSEVGDAETIRKMLADLPPKRHRVLVNPMHKTSRPRRLLNKQRNKLIMKKRPIEQSHGGPRRVSARADNSTPSVRVRARARANNDVPRSACSGQEDDEDEDNKPLKPKVQCLLKPRTRTSDVARKAALAKTKRRSIRVNKNNASQKLGENSNMDAQEAPLEKSSSKKVDVNQGACNTKQNTGHGQESSNISRNDENQDGHDTRENDSGSNKRDNREEGQPPTGPNRTNGNDNENNAGAPMPNNSPLKHSIARLTANTERHDKSMQFHHSFLVRQDCYNTDRHGPSGPRAQFENEAVASRLDKPPLEYDKSQLEIHAMQRNKFNKPKKGLNDCIAMLKNKLVEPSTTGHVSVQCGSDEPMSPLHLSPPLRPISQEAMMISPMSDYQNKMPESTGKHENFIHVGTEARPSVNLDGISFAVPAPRQTAPGRRYSTEHSPYTSRSSPSNETTSIPDIPRRRTSSSSNKISNFSYDETVYPSRKSMTLTDIRQTRISDYCPDIELQLPKSIQVQRMKTPNPRNASSTASRRSSIQCDVDKTYIAKPLSSTQSHPSKSGVDTPLDDFHWRKSYDNLLYSGRLAPARLPYDQTFEKIPHINNIPYEKISAPGNLTYDPAIDKMRAIPNVQCDTDKKVSTSRKIRYEQPAERIPAMFDLPYGHQLEMIPATPEANPYSQRGEKMLGMRDCTYDHDIMINYSDSFSTPQKLDNARLDGDLYRKVRAHMDNYGKSRVRTELPNTSIHVDLDLPSPLDLSGKSTNDERRHETYGNTTDRFSASSSMTEVVDLRVGTHSPSPKDFSAGSAATVARSNVPETSLIVDDSHLADLSEKRKETNDRVNLLRNNMEKYEEFLSQTKMKSSTSQDRLLISVVKEGKLFDQTGKVPSEKNLLRVRASELLQSTSSRSSEGSGANDWLHIKPLRHLETNIAHVPEKVEKGPNVSPCVYDGLVTTNSLSTETNTSNVKAKYITTGPYECQYTSSVYTVAKSVTKEVAISTTDKAKRGATIKSHDSASTLLVSSAKTSESRDSPKDVIIVDASDFGLTSSLHIGEKSGQYINQINEKGSNTNVTSIDPDTAKKIAMLPRELVEILGTMPADHRNQLLNVLPQYVATTMASPLSLPDTGDALTLNRSKIEDSDTSNKNSNAGIVITPHSKKSEIRFEENLTHKSTTTSITPSSSMQYMKDVKISQPLINDAGKIINLSKPEKELTNRHKISSLSDSMTTPVQLLGLSDDKVNGNDKRNETRELTCSTPLSLPTPTNLITTDKSIRRKSNNEQTANLRAVRIRAQTDRQKENLLSKEPVEEVPKLVIAEDNASNMPLEAKQVEEVQQAEISSTQAKEKTIDTNVLTTSPFESVSIVLENLRKPISDLKPESITFVEPTTVATRDVCEDKVCGAVSDEGIPDSRVSIVRPVSDIPNVHQKYQSYDSNNSLNVYNASKNCTQPKQDSNCSRENNIVQLSGHEDSKVNHEEGDSEDDVCLAAIVKFKKQGTNFKSNTQTSKKKKKKKAKKLVNKITKSDEKPESDEKPKSDEKPLLEVNKTNKINTNDNDAMDAKENLVAVCIENPKAMTTKLRETHKKRITKKQKINLPTESTSTIEPQVRTKSDAKGPSATKKKKIRKVVLKNIKRRIADAMVGNKSISVKESTIEQDFKTCSEADVPKSLNTINVHIDKIEQNVINSVKPEKFDRLKQSDDNVSKSVETVAPLRRSMRGKSLYSDDVLAESITPPSSENVTDQKVPVTKKQLIFYKLSLDEEKIAVNSSVTPSTDKKPLTVDSIGCSDEHIICDAERASVDEVLQTKSEDENVAETNKPIKRKISLQRLKSKKKKNFSNSQDTSYISSNILRTDSCAEVSTLETTVNKSSEEHNNEITVNKNNDLYADKVLGEQICAVVGKRKQRIDKADSFDAKKSKSTIEHSPLMKNEENALIEEKSTLSGDFGKSCKGRSMTCYDMPKVARRTRSKSVVAEPLAKYDPYDIDLDDMIEYEPVRKPFKSNFNTNCSKKSPKPENKLTVNEDEGVLSAGLQINFNADPIVSEYGNLQEEPNYNSENIVKNESPSKNNLDPSMKTKIDTSLGSEQSQINHEMAATEVNAKNNFSSDSDDSSKSDIPLKKYIEVKEKKQLAALTNNKTSVGASKKSNKTKHDQTLKLSVPEMVQHSEKLGSDNVSEEQLRSEQFMASFGFFSERKPRKSNLLASKKIAETFHTANESDYMFMKRITKRRHFNDSKSNSECSSQQDSSMAKKRGRKVKQIIVSKPERYSCDSCQKEFNRIDNLMRHRMTYVHAIKIPEFELKFGPPTADKPNYCLAFKEQMAKYKALTTSLKGKKKPKVKLPTMQDIVSDTFKAVRQEQLAARGLSQDEALFIDCCELLKESTSAMPKTEIGSLSNKKKVCYGSCRPPPKNDCDLDSITARSILESDEVRNLENDLISSFKEAASARRNMEQQNAGLVLQKNRPEKIETINSANYQDSNVDQKYKNDNDDESANVTMEKHRNENIESVTSSQYQDPIDAEEDQHSACLALEKYRRKIIESIVSSQYHDTRPDHKYREDEEFQKSASLNLNKNRYERIETITSSQYHDPSIERQSKDNEDDQQSASLNSKKTLQERIETITSSQYQDRSIKRNSKDNENDQQNATLNLKKNGRERIETITSSQYQDPSIERKSKDNEDHQQSANINLKKNLRERIETITSSQYQDPSIERKYEDHDQSVSLNLKNNLHERIETIASSQYQDPSIEQKSQDNEDHRQIASLNLKKNLYERIETITSSQYQDPGIERQSEDNEEDQESANLNLKKNSHEPVEKITSFQYHDLIDGRSSKEAKEDQQSKGLIFNKKRRQEIVSIDSLQYEDHIVYPKSKDGESDPNSSSVTLEENRQERNKIDTSPHYTDPNVDRNSNSDKEDEHSASQTTVKSRGGKRKKFASSHYRKQNYDRKGKQKESLSLPKNRRKRLDTVTKSYYQGPCDDQNPTDEEYQQSEILPLEKNQHETVETVTNSDHQDPTIDRNSKYDEDDSTDDTTGNKNFQYKEKMYPDLENIDIFEDKFDKIKRKCRSQAAAAKQSTYSMITEHNNGHKSDTEEVRKKKKYEKKKVKRNSKKSSQCTVLTKGALKGFDGVKAAIPTPDREITTAVRQHETTKKKRKKSSKKKRDKKSDSSNKYDSDERAKDSASQKKVDVYEFMDNEEAELLELRPSTLMERFRNINYDSAPTTSKHNNADNEADNSSGSVSDEDDFVYMSDDYVASEEETENSLLSDVGNIKNDAKKAATHTKRKEVTEKHAVMGKIFKNNAVRTEKKNIESVETAKPQANLDQLFDSLLKDAPAEDIQLDKNEQDIMSSKEESTSQSMSPISETYKTLSPDLYDYPSPKKDIKPRLAASAIPKSDSIYKNCIPSTSKQADEMDLLLDDFNNSSQTDEDTFPPKKHNVFTKTYATDINDTTNKFLKSGKKRNRTPVFENPVASDCERDLSLEDTGVARQRARRKCTVGKQNILAESWSSESEPDGGRVNSTESSAPGSHRKKKLRKSQVSGRRGNKQATCKKQDVSRVTSSKGKTSNGSDGEGEGNGDGGVAPAHAEQLQAEEERCEREQHGWIVGGSHKKLVTMLAHAKGRKRYIEDNHSLLK